MPPYFTVSTYVPCPDEALPESLARYADLLSRLGYQGRDVRAWLAEVAWPPHGEELGSALHPDAPLAALKVSGQPMLVLPVVSLWTPATIQTLEGQWLGLELAFDTHTPDGVSQRLISDPAPGEGFHYAAGVGHAIWQAMLAMRDTYPRYPIWAEYEGWDGEAWEALRTGKGSFWQFDAALLPSTYAARVPPTPVDYVRADLPVGIALARRTDWPIGA